MVLPSGLERRGREDEDLSIDRRGSTTRLRRGRREKEDGDSGDEDEVYIILGWLRLRWQGLGPGGD